MTQRNLILFGAVAGLYLLTGVTESWNLTLNILNFALLATIAALGVNIQWGYAGLFSVGTMGFTALGGLAVVLVSARPNVDNWQAGGWGVVLGLVGHPVAVCPDPRLHELAQQKGWEILGPARAAR